MNGSSAEPRLINDCFAHDRDRLRHDEALAILQERLEPIVQSNILDLDLVGGRVASTTITSPVAVPGADNSAVDGYAYNHGDIPATGGWLPVKLQIGAGHQSEHPLPIHAAARIFTGALMPERADTVAMQEDCELHEQEGQTFVIVPPDLKQGANRRRAGEDLQVGDTIVQAGQRLRPQDVAALASIGLAEIAVFDQLNVAIVSTGDELVRPGTQSRKPDQIFDANYYLLRALSDTLPVSIYDAGIWPDDYQTVRSNLAALSRNHHVVLTTGGASRGDADHLISALDELGQRHSWQLAIKPGRPSCFGQIGDCAIFSLPGNPVAAFVCFALYVRPALLRMAGANWRDPSRLTLPAQFSISSKKPDRREFLRGKLEVRDDGQIAVQRFPADGSGIITSLRDADGLIELPEPLTELALGQPVSFIPFSEFGIS